MFNRKAVKVGSFTLAVTAALLALLIIVNLFVTELPAKFTSIDTTKEKLYDIGTETKAMLDGVKDDVNVYMLIEKGQENQTTSTVESLILRYADECSHINYKVIDPALYPNFTKTYTEDTLTAGSVIVECGSKNRVIKGDEWYMYETAEGRITPSQYNYYNDMYSYYGSSFEAEYKFYGETNLTSAIGYVTSGTSSKIYFLTGHGEMELSGTFAEYISDANIETEGLSLIAGDGKIPDDCTALYIYCPSKDLTDAEVQTINDYRLAGGSVILVTYLEYFSKELEPNVAKLAASAGMDSADGMVFDPDTSHYQSAPYYLIPDVAPSCPDDLSIASGLTLSMPFSHGITEKEGTGCVYSALMQTSGDAFLRADIYGSSSYEKTDGDVEGQYDVAAISTLSVGTEGKEAQFVWYASPAFTDSQFDYGGNSEMFKALLKRVCNVEITSGIPGKTISGESLTLTQSDVNFWSTLLQIVLPVAVLIAGFIVWNARRRKK